MMVSVAPGSANACASIGRVSQNRANRGSSAPGRNTPITSRGAPSNSIVRPMTPESPPASSCHNPSLSTTTGAWPAWASSARGKRPSAGRTPRTSKYAPMIVAPSNWRAGPVPVSVATVEYDAPAVEKRSVRAKRSTDSRTVRPRFRTPSLGKSLRTTTSRPMSGMSSGRKRTVLTALTTVTFAPIASASVATVVPVNIGARSSARIAYRRSLSMRRVLKRDGLPPAAPEEEDAHHGEQREGRRERDEDTDWPEVRSDGEEIRERNLEHPQDADVDPHRRPGVTGPVE